LVIYSNGPNFLTKLLSKKIQKIRNGWTRDTLHKDSNMALHKHFYWSKLFKKEEGEKLRKLDDEGVLVHGAPLLLLLQELQEVRADVGPRQHHWLRPM